VNTVDPAALTSANQQSYVQFSFCDSDPTAVALVQSRERAAFTLRNRSCTAPNVARAAVSRTYFVADCNRCGSGGDTTPTLKRVDVVGGQLVETALVEGVETLRFEYGFDTNNDGNVDRWLAAPGGGATALWQNVVALRAHFIVRSVEPDASQSAAQPTAQTFTLGDLGTVTTAADGRVRRAYSLTVRLVNVAGPREAP
jgi:type IV pilus assembly protein PilW